MENKTSVIMNKYGFTGLNHKISVYIPGTVNVNETANNEKWINRACKGLSRLFGGCTAIKSNGYYVSENSDLISEKITIVYAYCSEADFTEDNITSVIAFCESMKHALKQECISLEIDNKLYFI